MKYNAGTTTMDRFKIIIGYILVAIGIFILSTLISFIPRANPMLWVIGFGLIGVGGYMARSIELYLFIIDAIQSIGGTTTPNGGRPFPDNKKKK